MPGTINVKSPNNTSKWQMGFNSAFKGLMMIRIITIIILATAFTVSLHMPESSNDTKCSTFSFRKLIILQTPSKYYSFAIIHKKMLRSVAGT
jgi:hypothetical protein